MGDRHQACFDSLTFGVHTTIGYFDLSAPANREKTLGNKAVKEGSTSGKWIHDHELEGKLEQLSLISGCRGPIDNGDKEETTKPQIVFLAAYGLPMNRDLAIRKDHFVNIMDTCCFPKEFYEALCEKTGHFAHFISFMDDESPGWISVVVKTPHSEANFSFVLRIRISDRSTVCLLMIQDDQMLDAVVHRLYARKRMLQEAPLQILSILCEEYGCRNELWREELDMSIVGLEQRIVKIGFDIKTFDEGISTDESLTRWLHKTNTNLTWLDCTTNFELNLLKFSKEMIELYETIRHEQDLTMLPRRCRTLIECEINSLMNSCSNRKYHGSRLQDRTKVQIAILSSQISQRDSRINLSTARASKNIAQSTLRDGRAMKTIAVLGLLFLPATFIASIYGAGIVDLRSDSIAVPRLWWTYAVASVALTLFVLIIWAVYIHHTNRKSVSKDLEELEKAEKAEKAEKLA
ncbi:hypothetical protein F5882DRAFT_115494 [Hyaloscypha sp. PMI_1271]|nr:hypothetical protein F5882DRAFT_115494 [Hyaloscypha sp. PMI_1271]